MIIMGLLTPICSHRNTIMILSFLASVVSPKYFKLCNLWVLPSFQFAGIVNWWFKVLIQNWYSWIVNAYYILVIIRLLFSITILWLKSFFFRPIIANWNKIPYFNFVPLTMWLTQQSYILVKLLLFWVKNTEGANWMSICKPAMPWLVDSILWELSWKVMMHISPNFNNK